MLSIGKHTTKMSYDFSTSFQSPVQCPWLFMSRNIKRSDNPTDRSLGNRTSDQNYTLLFFSRHSENGAPSFGALLSQESHLNSEFLNLQEGIFSSNFVQELVNLKDRIFVKCSVNYKQVNKIKWIYHINFIITPELLEFCISSRHNGPGQFSINYFQTLWEYWIRVCDILRLLPEKNQVIPRRGFEINKLNRTKWDDFLPCWSDWVILPFEAEIVSIFVQTCLCQRGRGIQRVRSLVLGTASLDNPRGNNTSTERMPTLDWQQMKVLGSALSLQPYPQGSQAACSTWGEVRPLKKMCFLFDVSEC